MSGLSIACYGAMGVAALVCAVAAAYYLVLSTRIAEILGRHSEEWRQIMMGAPDFLFIGRRRIRMLDWIILFGEYPRMLPPDPAVALVLRRARLAGWIFFIAFVAALVCLGAADNAARSQAP